MNKVERLKQEVPKRSRFLKEVSAELRWYCHNDSVELEDFLEAFRNKYKNSIEFYITNSSENRSVCDEIEVMKILLGQSTRLIQSKVREMGEGTVRRFLLSCMSENTYSRARSLRTCPMGDSRSGFMQTLNDKFAKRQGDSFESMTTKGGI